MERAAVEDAVHRPDDRPPVGGDRRQREQAHPGQALGDLLGGQAALRGEDPEQMRPGDVVAAVEQRLQRGEVGRRLVHRRRFSHTGARARDNHRVRKLQSQGVHHITIVGADRQTSIDFWEGLLGMPFVFEQPNLDNESEPPLLRPG